MTELPVPAFPSGLEGLLLKTIDDMAADAEKQLQQHLATHKMSAEGENWISAGIGHVGDDCPFCGQSIKGLPLVTAFKAVFSEQYKNLQAEIEAMQASVLRQLGEAALANQATIAERNKSSAEFWQKYVTFDWPKTEYHKSSPQHRKICASARSRCLVPKDARRLRRYCWIASSRKPRLLMNGP